MAEQDLDEPSENTRLLPPADGQSTREQDRWPTFTARSVAVGLVIGGVTCLSNVYFGLQNGYADTMALGSSLLGFAFFRPFHSRLRPPFGPKENVIIQTVAGAFAAMPMTAGLVNIIVALENLIDPAEGGPLHFTWLDLTIWALGLSCSGTFLAMLLRTHILQQDNMPFPSATASATVIESLHGGKEAKNHVQSPEEETSVSTPEQQEGPLPNADVRLELPSNYGRYVFTAFLASALTTLVEIFLPILHSIPFLGDHMARNWLWTFNLSAGMFGQGMITGPIITLHMLLGTIVGWGILSPIAKNNGWAPGDVGDWTIGSRGWTLWIALSILLTDCLITLSDMILSLEGMYALIRVSVRWVSKIRVCYPPRDPPTSQSPSRRDNVSRSNQSLLTEGSTMGYDLRTNEMEFQGKQFYRTLSMAVFASAALCACTTKYVFGEQIPVAAVVLAVIISLFLGLISIRAMGQTDHSPVGGLAKLSQFLFALVISKSNPRRFIINLVAGSIGEAGALQATSLMFDLKTGNLLGANPLAQMSAHMIGSFFGALVSPAFYKLYTTSYAVPGPLFQAPTAYIWVAAARLANGAGFPPGSINFSIAFAVGTAITTVIKIRCHNLWWSKFIPGGVAFAIGIYNAPSFTLPRLLGGIAFWFCQSRLAMSAISLRLVAAGLILGESIFSLVGLLIRN